MNKLTTEIYREINISPITPHKYVIYEVNIKNKKNELNIKKCLDNGDFKFIAKAISDDIDFYGRKKGDSKFKYYVVELQFLVSYYKIMIYFGKYGKIHVSFLNKEISKICENLV